MKTWITSDLHFGLIDAIRLNIQEYTAMTEQERLAWVRNFVDKAE